MVIFLVDEIDVIRLRLSYVDGRFSCAVGDIVDCCFEVSLWLTECLGQ